ncbi:hypothetical protein PHMEG_00010304 [Phytophthora megakarya]|uniref:Uncharacterized protein n=1 Tax=Phytophthora megakarya TaxID=4795 RepID=A0A225WG17_9STRA|nr:hypothetical protein PHMEG_00010304 [Phytophthora megakarya]
MPRPPGEWKQTVRQAPLELIQTLQEFRNPSYILAGMTDATLDSWMLASRLAVLLHCLEHIEKTTTDDNCGKWANDWAVALRNQASADLELINLYSGDLWKPLKRLKYQGMELLKLCRSSQKEKKRSRKVHISTEDMA